jgi:hypothetical protein
MKPRFVLTLLFLAILARTTRSEAGELAGVYVEKNVTRNRIELLPDGTYYAVFPYEGLGTYTKTHDTLTCIDAQNGDKMEFTLKGDSLIESVGPEWVRRETLLKFPWKEAVPVSFVVVDEKTRAPIAEFAYSYRISTQTAEFDPLLVRPIAVKSPNGTFSLLAPKSCEIELHLEGGMVIVAPPWFEQYALTPDTKDRRFEVPVRTGVAVEGAVVDAHTKAPVAGALVSPIMFTPPDISPDRNRSVKTDAQGRFQIRGIDPSLGFDVWHADYPEFNRGGFVRVGEEIIQRMYTVRVELKVADLIAGTVKDVSGKPLADVKVSDENGRSVRTRADGSFSQRGPSSWDFQRPWYLTFEKDGYLSQRANLMQNPPVKSPHIVLERPPVLTGKVVGPDGRPVAPFTLVAGPGREPYSGWCSSQTVDEPGGPFSVPIRTDFDYGYEGKVWMAVKAPNFAMWEAVADRWQGTKAITVQLKAGVSVRGAIKTANNSGQMIVELLPVRQKEDFCGQISERQDLGRMHVTVDEGGAFRFDHVPPGAYRLGVSGSAISPLSTGLTVGDADVDLGTLTAAGRGAIAGVVYHDKKPGRWAFAKGKVLFKDSSGRWSADEFGHRQPIPFKADENGEFRLDNIPVGDVLVDVPLPSSGDIINSEARKAQVFEGQTTKVRADASEPSIVWLDPSQIPAQGISYSPTTILMTVALCATAMAICLRLSATTEERGAGRETRGGLTTEQIHGTAILPPLPCEKPLLPCEKNVPFSHTPCGAGGAGEDEAKCPCGRVVSLS